MNQRLTIVVIPTKKKNPDLVLKNNGWMVGGFANWATLLKVMQQKCNLPPVSITVAERISADGLYLLSPPRRVYRQHDPRGFEPGHHPRLASLGDDNPAAGRGAV